jgi:hypothetical protein
VAPEAGVVGHSCCISVPENAVQRTKSKTFENSDNGIVANPFLYRIKKAG